MKQRGQYPRRSGPNQSDMRSSLFRAFPACLCDANEIINNVSTHSMPSGADSWPDSNRSSKRTRRPADRARCRRRVSNRPASSHCSDKPSPFALALSGTGSPGRNSGPRRRSIRCHRSRRPRRTSAPTMLPRPSPPWSVLLADDAPVSELCIAGKRGGRAACAGTRPQNAKRHRQDSLKNTSIRFRHHPYHHPIPDADCVAGEWWRKARAAGNRNVPIPRKTANQGFSR